MIVDFECECGQYDEDVYCDKDDTGKPIPRVCHCGKTMSRVFTPVRAIFAGDYFRGTHPRRIEAAFTDENGKKHHINLTHKVGNVTTGQGENG